MIGRKEVDKVLMYNVSRSFRSMVHFKTFYEYFKKDNVELISVCEGLRSSRKEHLMIFGIMCSVASFKKDKIHICLQYVRNKRNIQF
jgi:DNA invertase Pin-like site-specific DNA recombinase